jgi:hypothetical protein
LHGMLHVMAIAIVLLITAVELVVVKFPVLGRSRHGLYPTSPPYEPGLPVSGVLVTVPG